ncbi:hypothetical protein TTHERM_00703520 (macronuclear) [Tetrahymena thermophila SB210]|uniref:Uncharacterized protein n=1 Tax=Tetrahymena thermophila (strain SB210) TaxID=312017 RepID=Q22GH1_TETTS|nr:hypothetical protein TTHERM_00703520 [Tetrahymena thermophila SB210]EAR84360.3 hypothetical protein TTHERM_00703520 [Tetrahymena thermophila SB210]|eukprot:XP_001032023.3 hypothetical protein TTHERM_00703520 [Tetrahymena thermophila SB210]
MKNSVKEKSLNKNHGSGDSTNDGKQRFYNSNSVNRKNVVVQSQAENDDNPLLIFDKIDNILLKSANYSFINKENLEKDLLKLYNLENLTDQKAKQIIKQLNHSPMQMLKNGLKNQSHIFRNKIINPGRANANENNQQVSNVHKIQYISQKRYRKNGSSSSSLRRSEKGYTLGLLNSKNQNNFYSNNPQNARNSSNIKKASMISYQAKSGLNASTNQIKLTHDEDLEYQTKHEALTPQRYKRSFDKQLSPQLSQNKNGSLDDTNTKPQIRLPFHDDECEDLQDQNMQEKSFSSQKNEANKAASLNTQNSPSVKIIKMNNLLSHNIQKDICESPNSNKYALKTEFSQIRGNPNEIQSISLNQETPTKEVQDNYQSQGSHQACWDIYKINEKKQLQLKSTNLQDEMKRIDELQIKNEKAISNYIQIRQDLLDLAISQKLKQIQKGIKVQKN